MQRCAQPTVHSLFISISKMFSRFGRIASRRTHAAFRTGVPKRQSGPSPTKHRCLHLGAAHRSNLIPDGQQYFCGHRSLSTGAWQASVARGGTVKTNASGLQYISHVEGSGDRPNLGDKISVHYYGFLEDGTTFDSSW